MKQKAFAIILKGFHLPGSVSGSKSCTFHFHIKMYDVVRADTFRVLV